MEACATAAILGSGADGLGNRFDFVGNHNHRHNHNHPVGRSIHPKKRQWDQASSSDDDDRDVAISSYTGKRYKPSQLVLNWESQRPGSPKSATTSSPFVFHVPLTKSEQKRRKERKERFGATTTKSTAATGTTTTTDGKNKTVTSSKSGKSKTQVAATTCSSNNNKKLIPINPLYKPLSADDDDEDLIVEDEEEYETTASFSSSAAVATAAKKQSCASAGDCDFENNAKPFVGENKNLEKPYFRLTTYPRKEDVRPLKVLVKSLAHIKARYLKDEDFEWANEQLKSVRQDLTVQQIRNRFVLDVYETHARILLEHGDLDEFNQCQTMIRTLTERRGVRNGSSSGASGSGSSINKRVRSLSTSSSSTETTGEASADGDAAYDSSTSYSSSSSGSSSTSASAASKSSSSSSSSYVRRWGGNNKPLSQTPESADEFRGYAILYALVRNSCFELKTELAGGKLSNNLRSSTAQRNRSNSVEKDKIEATKDETKDDDDSSDTASSETSSSSSCCDRESSCWHAVQVVKAVEARDYHTFFRLYDNAPHMSAYLMDFLVKRVRDFAFERIVASYRPNVSVEHFREALHFTDYEETRRFLRHKGAVFVVEERTSEAPDWWVDCKATHTHVCKQIKDPSCSSSGSSSNKAKQ